MVESLFPTFTLTSVIGRVACDGRHATHDELSNDSILR